MIPILPQNHDSAQQSIQILGDGGVVAHAADTCYGLLGDFLNKQSLRSIQQLKGRDAKKPMSVMLPLNQKSRVGEYAVLDDFSSQVWARLLPGPVTLVLPKGPKVPDWYFPETNLIGLRIPNSQQVQQILEAFGGPLITTSANPSGRPVCRSAQEVVQAFEGKKDLLELVLESEQKLGHLPSTVIQISSYPPDASDDYNRRLRGVVQVLRQGPVNKEEISQKLEGLEFDFIENK